MKINLVADLFAADYGGGAELTTEALMENIPVNNINRIYSHTVTEDLILNKKNEKWIFGNYSKLNDSVMLYFAKHKLDYHVLEYDYKFCTHRSPTLHNLAVAKKCDCNTSPHGKIVSLFLAMAKNVFWMSEQQLQIYKGYFNHISKGKNTVLSSVFCQRDIKYILELNKHVLKNDQRYLILQSSSPVKDSNAGKEYAEQNDLAYEPVGNLPYFQFLRKLASMKGLIFLPRSEDTCPRLIIEAALLNCDIRMNHFVQHQTESWFESKEKILEHMESRVDTFWGLINE